MTVRWGWLLAVLAVAAAFAAGIVLVRAAPAFPLRQCEAQTAQHRRCRNPEWKAKRNGYCWRHQFLAR